jgi:hypothetical protein
MLNENLLDNTSGWLIFFCSLLLMIAGNYFGYRFGQWHKKRMPEAQDTSNAEIMGAIFGVLGFTLAFLFGMSLTRLEHKKEMVMGEASAILAAYQNSQFLPEPYKTQCGRMLRDYAGLRYELATKARAERNITQIKEGVLLCERIQDSLLEQAIVIKELPGSDISSFLGSVTSIIDWNMRRVNNATGDRIPRSLKILMYVMALMGLAGMGYGSGLKGGRSLIPNFILVIVFAGIIGIILDMDHPANSLFKVSQEPMHDVIRRINSMHL